jgi:hypothetical protein
MLQHYSPVPGRPCVKVTTMLPSWVDPWCRAHLGSSPTELLHRSAHMSEVFGLRLADGREVAVKARPDQNGRAATCVEAMAGPLQRPQQRNARGQEIEERLRLAGA